MCAIKNNILNIQEITWDQIRESIKIKDYELFSVIENISPSKEFSLIKANYSFGSKIVDNGLLELPLISGNTLPITSSNIPNHIKRKLSYSPIPLGFLSNKSGEVYIENGNRSFPLALLGAGKLFGLFEITDILVGIMPEPNWSVSSGSRFMFMLPNISEECGYKRFNKELGISVSAPKSFVEHGKIFIKLCNHPDYMKNWQNEVIFFTNKWFKNSLSDPIWSVFYNYLFKSNALQRSRSYKDSTFEIIWSYSQKAILNEMKELPHRLLNSIKYLIAIATGIMPAFCNADSSEESAPSRLIQKLYTEIYQLNDYIPTLMYPYHQIKGNILRPSYFSISSPTMFNDVTDKTHDGLSDLSIIQKALEILYNNHYCENNYRLPKSYSLLENVQYKLHHHKSDSLNSIESFLSFDRHLLNDNQLFPGRVVCKESDFFNGCIQIFSCLTSDNRYPYNYGYKIFSEI